jgi:hypothetical protein
MSYLDIPHQTLPLIHQLPANRRSEDLVLPSIGSYATLHRIFHLLDLLILETKSSAILGIACQK